MLRPMTAAKPLLAMLMPTLTLRSTIFGDTEGAQIMVRILGELVFTELVLQALVDVADGAVDHSRCRCARKTTRWRTFRRRR